METPIFIVLWLATGLLNWWLFTEWMKRYYRLPRSTIYYVMLPIMAIMGPIGFIPTGLTMMCNR